MANTGYINGSDLLLSVAGKCVGHCTKHETTYSSDTKERAVKPLASAAQGSAGLFKSKSVTGLKISISANGVAFYGETENGMKELLAGWYAGKSVGAEALVQIVEREVRNGGGDTGAGPTGTPTPTSRDETGEQLYNRLLSGGKK